MPLPLRGMALWPLTSTYLPFPTPPWPFPAQRFATAHLRAALPFLHHLATLLPLESNLGRGLMSGRGRRNADAYGRLTVELGYINACLPHTSSPTHTSKRLASHRPGKDRSSRARAQHLILATNLGCQRPRWRPVALRPPYVRRPILAPPSSLTAQVLGGEMKAHHNRQTLKPLLGP